VALLSVARPCSGRTGGLNSRRREPLPEVSEEARHTFAEEDEDDESVDSFLQVRRAVPGLGSLGNVLGASAGGQAASVWPVENPDALYAESPFRRRRTEVAKTTLPPKQLINATAPCVNGSGPPDVVEVKVPVEVPVNVPGQTVNKNVYIPVPGAPQVQYVNVPGDTVYVPVPQSGPPLPPVVMPGAPAPVPPGCPVCGALGPATFNGGSSGNVAAAGVAGPAGAAGGVAGGGGGAGACPQAAPCISGDGPISQAAGQAVELAHNAMQDRLNQATGGTPSPLAQRANAVAQMANARAAAAADAATYTQARLDSVEKGVKRLRNNLYRAATARASELNKVRVVPPTFPHTLLPPRPPPPGFGLHALPGVGWIGSGVVGPMPIGR